MMLSIISYCKRKLRTFTNVTELLCRALIFKSLSELPFHLHFTLTCRMHRGLIIIMNREMMKLRHRGIGDGLMGMKNNRG